MKRKTIWTLLAAPAMALGMACDVPEEKNNNPQEFIEADANRGGAMYDKWWAVLDMDEPTEDHPFWADRPDMDSNDRTGKDTWRCKECHGWDYLGVDGAYADGSHKTGFDGVYVTDRAPVDVFDSLKTDHGFGDAGLSDDDLWDLTRFVLVATVDVGDFISGDAFSGDSALGETHFENACVSCHGSDGLTPPPGADADFEDFVGAIANDNPWEFLHKARFGQPGTQMPPQADLLTDEELADLGAFAQTLPMAP
jgi:thiosulfate dehydrogenase